ncbi:lipocalin family protein [Massilia sp. S19_KUP03_FR1]|uniref:lipocalin family protein n=1 Tax=Massilia sp. S19_KUP03_FR1 TaxID=3025503 RepID=UPI002FCDAB82
MKKYALIGLLAMAATAAADTPLTTIPTLDTARYAGTWYEIAKYPNYFQRKCLSNTVANYSAQPDGTIRVDNRCTQEGNKVEQAVGQARQPGGPGSPKLEVRFAPAWLSLLPFVWGNYWVIDLDPGYTLVAVSEPKREYLWILSRTAKVEPQAYAGLVQRLAAKGFDTSKLVVTKQGN